ncbi:guanylate kinase [Ferroacidibacillus organovorans]|uniref:Guanylate kinase n=1 Tax=Ferroacidibacillus organovorans TaxID=1765683 RepID=A0A853KAF6_9BACL|nr:guanylate kinase [Ferroacidibacillus organovorans]KYP81522.1 hypothetical protein AYJ22_07275 [Ferroacidibacillus organovorans]OAG94045.1 hypothetical protein AYW79_07375 [Ferroacidibacillus organovorans]
MVPEHFIEFDPVHRQDRRGRFFILSGPSGVGKNTLLAKVLTDLPWMYYVPSATTRAMRPGEYQFHPYVFLSTEEFEGLIEKGQFLEWKRIHNASYYGTHRPTIEHAIEQGYDLITDMDVLGCADAVAAFPEDTYTIFITPPNLNVLSDRLLSRDADVAAVSQRLKRVELEMGHMNKYDYVLVNDDLEVSAQQLKELLRASLVSVKRAGSVAKTMPS